MVLIPYLLMLIGFIIMWKSYDLTDEKIEFIIKKLEELKL